MFGVGSPLPFYRAPLLTIIIAINFIRKKIKLNKLGPTSNVRRTIKVSKLCVPV